MGRLGGRGGARATGVAVRRVGMNIDADAGRLRTLTVPAVPAVVGGGEDVAGSGDGDIDVVLLFSAGRG